MRYVEAIASVKECLGEHQLGDIMQMILARSGYDEFLRLERDQVRLD